MLPIAVLLAASEIVALTQESQVKELCEALRAQPADTADDPAAAAEALKAALARRDEAASHSYLVEVPSKGFAFGRYRAQDKQLELDGDRPLRALEGALALDLEGVDDVAFNARAEQVSAWSREKKGGALRLVVVWKPNGDRCAGSAAAQAWRIAGHAQSWELVGAEGRVAAANAEGDPVGGAPRAVRIEKVSLESDDEPAPNDGRDRLVGAQRALDKCASSAQRGGTLLVSFSIQGGHVRDAQVIMDSLRDDKVAGCVAQAVNGAPISGSGRGTASVSLE